MARSAVEFFNFPHNPHSFVGNQYKCNTVNLWRHSTDNLSAATTLDRKNPELVIIPNSFEKTDLLEWRHNPIMPRVLLESLIRDFSYFNNCNFWQFVFDILFDKS